MNETKQPEHFWKTHTQLNKELHRESIDTSAVTDGVSRRNFLGVMGASAALAGVGLSGCIRKPVEHIAPYAKRPEDLIPGKPVFYATAFALGTKVTRLLVESQDGRPTKIEGLPEGGKGGGADAWAQAEILNLYDPERSSHPGTFDDKGKKADLSWSDAYASLDGSMALSRKNQGKGLALVVDTVMSPTYRRTLEGLTKGQLSGAKLYVADPAYPHNRLKGAEIVAGRKSYTTLTLANADIVATFDSDCLHTDGDWSSNASGFAEGRSRLAADERMNRLYAVEPTMSLTGANADHRARVKASDVGNALQAVAFRLLAKGVGLTAGGPKVYDFKFPAATDAILNALVDDLAGNKGRSVVVVGERQPAWVHALGHYINEGLDANREIVTWRKDSGMTTVHQLPQLVTDLNAGAVDTVVCLGTNPAYVATGDLKFADAYKKAATRIHLGLHADETAVLSTLHIPVSHYLEAWGDVQSQDGVTTVAQPLIAPLFHTPSLLELAARLRDGKKHNGLQLVQGHLSRGRSSSFAAGKNTAWKKWLFDGKAAVRSTVGPATASNWPALTKAMPKNAKAGTGFELNFHMDSSVYDGRYAMNAWCQELPDPISKLTWDNAATISRTMAKTNELANGDMITISWEDRTLTMPVWVTPGTADDTISLPLGYGRKSMGEVAGEAGFNTYSLQKSAGGYNPWIGFGAQFKKEGSTYELASTQHHDSLTPYNDKEPGTGVGTNRRPLIRVADKTVFLAKPDFVNDDEVIKDPTKIRSLSGRPQEDETVYKSPQQWGMTIDLNTCLGCNACVLACNAENNVSMVGKAQVLNGREMHWLRMDRYFEGSASDDNPQMVVQPVGCMQCENAPCETVCPVAATTHSPDGLNDMAYNRCIGTRYCANNCPYKVRRFNYFNFNTDIHPLHQMQKNPDVTIRFRGVMEKCTYCVQRISEAKIDAKVRGNGLVPDIDAKDAKSKKIMTACQQACPSDSIVFGDINDPNSRVSKAKRSTRSYDLLGELNNKPRTSYLAKIRNPHPKLATQAEKKG
jgi:Fe-S-cluster-containing dehydrogenase component